MKRGKPKRPRKKHAKPIGRNGRGDKTKPNQIRTPAQVQEDGFLLARILKRGQNFDQAYSEINAARAGQYQLSYSQIVKDAHIIFERYRTEALLSIQTAKAIYLQKILTLEKEAWERFRDKTERTETEDEFDSTASDDEAETQSRIIKKAAEKLPKLTKKTVKKFSADPDIAYLNIIQWCYTQYAQIYGIFDSPPLTTPDAMPGMPNGPTLELVEGDKKPAPAIHAISLTINTEGRTQNEIESKFKIEDGTKDDETEGAA